MSAPARRGRRAADAGPVRRQAGSLNVLQGMLLGAGALFLAVVASQGWRAAEAPPTPPLGVEEHSPLPPAPQLAPRPSRRRQAPLPRPVEGRPLFELSAPKLGQEWTVVEGVSLDDIRHHPGHYPGSALPGQIGNVAVAGHRLSGLFWDLDQLHVGDPLIVRMAGQSYVYRVYDREIVAPTALYVVSPDPDRPGQAPQRAILTLTTCLKTGHQAREIVHAYRS